MLQFNKPLTIILDIVHLGLVGQETVVLEVLIEPISKYSSHFAAVLVHSEEIISFAVEF